jgi:hypothetical protein
MEVAESIRKELNKRKDDLASAAAPRNVTAQMRKTL